ncbi:MAG: cation acetate symporter, partial [Zoogloeaceae bacterium]|nr:cation acetate symporter [Zoogloeaceae bacterium]
MNAGWRLLGGMGLLEMSAVAPAETRVSSLIPQHIDNWTVTAVFAVCVIVALIVARLAAVQNRSAAGAYEADGGMVERKNGLAMTGDYLSAVSLLGIPAIIMTCGEDGLIYAVGFLAGWPLMTFLMAERLKNLGKFTFADVVAYRFHQVPIRVFAASSTLTVTVLYLAAQMVGVGQLIRLLFGLEYWMAVTIAGAMMMLYARLVGMSATTWIAIVKAVLLLAGAFVMVFMTLLKLDFNFGLLLAGLAEKESFALSPEVWRADPVSTLSLGMTLMFGVIGLPHVLMRFFTAPGAKDARCSAFRATVWNGCFYMLSIIIGLGALCFVLDVPVFLEAGGNLKGGENMAAIHLAYAVGGEAFMGFMAAVAFVTILAVAARLVLAGAATVSHDLYASVFRKGRPEPGSELRVAHATALCLGALAVLLGMACEDLNIAVMVSLVFAIAASSCFPVLFLSIFWKNCTTRGAVIGGFVGLGSA